MLTDGSLGEILSGLHGLPYAELETILPLLPVQTFGRMTLDFQRTASHIRRLRNMLEREQDRIVTQLMSWVTIQTGLPGNARHLALRDAADRLTRLP